MSNVWNNEQILELYTFLGNLIPRFSQNISQEHLIAILNEETLQQYWIPAFTHSSFNLNKNYESLEAQGDRYLGTFFLKYLLSKFGNLTPVQITYFENTYMSKTFQAQLANRLSLGNYVKYNPTMTNMTKTILEDLFESFSGALVNVVDNKIANFLGGVYLYNLIVMVFNDVKLSLDEVERDSISQLKEIYDKLNYGTISKFTTNSDNVDRPGKKVIIYAQNGSELGVGYGEDVKDAEMEAAKNALESLSKRGITRESAEEFKRKQRERNNPDYEKQTKRVEQAIKVLNTKIEKEGKAKIVQWKVSAVKTTSTQSGNIYTASLEIGYNTVNGVQWVVGYTVTCSGRNTSPIETQIKVMKDFADNNNIA